MPKTLKHALADLEHAEGWNGFIHVEYDYLTVICTLHLVPWPNGANVIAFMWVFNFKADRNGGLENARLDWCHMATDRA